MDPLQEAAEQMQAALRSLDAALASTPRQAPGLGELERDAVVQLRGELVNILRRTRNLQKFAAGGRT